jgi:septal ring factor EnvC (AmiA/AmiB activator)
VPLTSFSADVYTQEDLLDIDRSVESLALVMASTRTVTPLAIGVFGPWGSGKSFFMRHLQRCIDRVRHHEQARINRWIEKRREGPASVKDAPLYFGEIAQVEFNAWQYNEGNLVASLVEHLFRNLRHLPDNGDGGLKARRDEMLMKLDAMQREAAKVDKSVMAAEKDVTTARNEVDKAAREAGEAKEKVSASAREIQSHRAKLDTELARLDDALRAASLKPGAVARDAVIAVALEPLAPFFAKVQSTVGQARDQIFDWQDFFDRVFTTKGLVVIGLCVAVPLVMLLNDYLMAQWTALAGAVALAIKGLGSALDVFKESRRKFEETLAALDKEQQRRVDEVASKIRQQQQSLTDSVQREISALSAELDTRRRNLADREAAMNLAAQNLAARAQEHEDRLAARLEAEEKMRAAQDELDRLSSSLLLDEFLTDRATTDEYRKQLGILAQVRHDIERLSGLIEKSNKDWLALDNVDKKVAVPPVSRIVLYIDDLDRCKESTVLAVLEAVHLLLAFPLFVCAVAVDPRWVEKCLRETRKQMFIEEVPPGGKANGAAVATVGDYLEKIFQIPIWMSPIESKTRAQLVTKLLGPTAAPAAPMAVGNGAIHGNQPQGGNHQQTNAFETLVARVREKPDPLEIHADEAAFIDEISDLLSDRPRALKRFVNTYRLLKASLPDIERAAFVTKDPSSPHRACLVQLAFFTSRSRLAGDLIAKLEAQARRDAVPGANGAAQDSATLGTWIEKAFPGDSPVRRALEAIPASATIPLGVFQHWLPCTSRYLFHRAE